MEIYYVYEDSWGGGRLHAIHTRRWMAEYRAYTLALELRDNERELYGGLQPTTDQPVYIASPAWGYPGWTNAEDDCEATTYVTPVKVNVP